MKSKLTSGDSILTAIAFLSILVSGCDNIRDWIGYNRDEQESVPKASLELLYQTASLELSLANSGKPYLVIDVPRKSIELRLKGAIVLRVPMNLVEAEPGDLDKFIASFGSDGTLLRPLMGKYLFESIDQTPDSVLKIVSEVVNVKPELLQREIPERFRIYWNDKLNLDIVSKKDSLATPKPKAKESFQKALQGKFEDMKMEARYVMRKPFGVRLIVVEAKAEDALTIYRVAEAGIPTLLQLVSTEPVTPAVKTKKKK